MNSTNLINALGYKRLWRYIDKCHGDHDMALLLYYDCVELASLYYCLLSCFEIVLRNKIDEYLTREYVTLTDSWLTYVIRPGGEFDKYQTHRNKIEIKRAMAIKQKCQPLTNDDILADLSFGFWVSLFSRYQYNALEGNLLDIFVNMPKIETPSTNTNENINTKRIMIESTLREIKNFRNRIAHFDNIIFSKDNCFNWEYLQQMEELVLTVTRYLDIDTALYNPFLEKIKTRSHILANRGAGNT